MAIDTAAKRFRIMDFDTPASSPALPPPSGTIDAGERAAFLWLYLAAATVTHGASRGSANRTGRRLGTANRAGRRLGSARR